MTEPTTSDGGEDEGVFHRHFVAVLIFVVLMIVISAWYLLGVRGLTNPASLDDASKYGDSFGALNALFSGLAFGGVIVALVLQMQELSLQRRELQETKEELRKSAEAQAELVALNALTALVEHYGTEYRPRRDEIDKDYRAALETDPIALHDNIKYKYEVTVHLLEAQYSKASGNDIHPSKLLSPSDLAERLWLEHFASELDSFLKRVDWQDKKWSEAKGGGRTYTVISLLSELRSALHTLHSGLRELAPRVYLTRGDREKFEQMCDAVIRLTDSLYDATSSPSLNPPYESADQSLRSIMAHRQELASYLEEAEAALEDLYARSSAVPSSAAGFGSERRTRTQAG